ncbi:RimK family alpha-L-glutamate ligase [Actinoplanes sp. N902-109]|uniref:ATP-grasp domain-containing protein n=1 Tax=Actinoplanes sp. (strain N902-109) TaxID=649831 RepID=UPI000329605C|nr:hypothetical protein [Actinoplanes sp. N902-109]AGL18894.1 hypothetical protein L083_5384 [Actinoplanes sp. N902-109]
MTRYDIGLLTTDVPDLVAADVDLVPLTEALTGAGLRVGTPVWHDPTIDWSRYDLVVMRCPWDYPERYPEFMAWLDRAAAHTRILNPPRLIRWNIDKRYLDDLRERGVSCVPYVFCETTAEAAAAVAKLPGRAVIKPSVSAGSRDTGLFEPGDPAAAALVTRILAAGKTVMVQPAAETVITGGENALFFYAGVYAYAVHKGPILLPGGNLVGGTYTEVITRTTPSPAEIDLGRRAVAAAAAVAGEPPLYARVDIASDNGTDPAVLEVEVFEPSYFLDVVPEATPTVVEAFRARLGQA